MPDHESQHVREPESSVDRIPSQEGGVHAVTRNSPVDDENDPPLDQDVLWEILEEAFHEMLDPLFKERESEEEEAIRSRADRSRWSKEINEHIAETERDEGMKRELANGAETDPLVATAAGAYNNRLRNCGRGMGKVSEFRRLVQWY